jgi:hypothetical protein
MDERMKRELEPSGSRLAKSNQLIFHDVCALRNEKWESWGLFLWGTGAGLGGSYKSALSSISVYLFLRRPCIKASFFSNGFFGPGSSFFFLLLSALLFVSGADERGGVWCVLVCWSIGITIDTPVGLFWGAGL